MHTTLTRQLVAVTLLCIATASAMAGGELRVPLPAHGAVVLTVPPTWNEQVRRPMADLPPTIALSPKSGPNFQVLITPLWPANASIPKPSAQAVLSHVRSAAQHAMLQSVETDIPVLELVGPQVWGNYFSATDRAPKPDEFRNMTQGMLALGDLRVTFTVLSNGDPASVVGPALQMLRSMRRE